MAIDHGVIIYEILPNSCLNGIYSDTNKIINNQVFNEILRKKEAEDNGELSGNYLSTCIDVNDSIVTYDVVIYDNNGRIEILWYKGKKKRFEGTGWRLKYNQLIVSYRYV